MTAPTPEQLRALADSADESLSYVGDGDWSPQDTMLQQTAAALRTAADQLEAVQAEVIRYAGWHEQSPEDSWRFERDIRAALGMEQYGGDDDDRPGGHGRAQVAPNMARAPA